MSARRSRACFGRSCWFIRRRPARCTRPARARSPRLPPPARSTSLASSSSSPSEVSRRLPTDIIESMRGGRSRVRLVPAGDPADAGAEPAHVDVEIVELAAAVAARDLGHLDRRGRCPRRTRRCALRACSVTRSTTMRRAVSTTLFALGHLAVPPPPEVTCQPWYLQKSKKKPHGSQPSCTRAQRSWPDRSVTMGCPGGCVRHRRAHGGADDGELDDLAAVVAALAARAHGDHAARAAARPRRHRRRRASPPATAGPARGGATRGARR